MVKLRFGMTVSSLTFQEVHLFTFFPGVKYRYRYHSHISQYKSVAWTRLAMIIEAGGNLTGDS